VRLRRLQLVSAAAFSFSHGTNDAQKSMGIITAALVTGGVMSVCKVPYWVMICYALAKARGTMAGGFAAETSAAITLIGTAPAGIPATLTHVITGAISGVGASRRLTAARWGVTRHSLWAWIVTIPGARLMGAIFLFLFRYWVR
jgi:PiT family inorganic phosphate transporter